MKIHFKKYILKTPYQVALLSIIFTICYITFIPKYTCYVYDSMTFTKNVFYKDLNHDGQSEMIEYFGYSLSSDFDRATVIVKSLGNAFLGTWNHKGRYIRISQPVFCDYNHDGITDIFTFHRHLDSVFINGINPDSSDLFFVQSRFIDTTRWVNNTVNIKVLGLGFEDYNNDGFDDIVFQIDAGFSLQPRNTYVFDVKNDTVLKSPLSFSHLAFPFGLLFDLNDDGKDEIILSTHASENIRDFSLPYHDYSSYVMVLNSQLKFINKPYEIKGSMSNIRAYPMVYRNKKQILIHYHNYGDRFSDSLFLFSANAQLVRALCLDSLINKYNSPVTMRIRLNLSDYNYINQPIIGLKNGMIFHFDSILKITQRIQTDVKPLTHAILLELNGDSSQTEYLLSDNKKLYFTDHNFNELASPDLELDALKSFGRISTNNNHTNHFFVQDKNNIYQIIFELNSWYSHAWVVLILSFLIIWLLVFSIKGILKIIRYYQMTDMLQKRDSLKTHLARELHDELGSKITGLRLMLENLEISDSVKEVHKVSDHLQKTHQEIRNIIYNLAPPNLKHKSYALTINQLIASFDNISEINFQLEFIPNNTIADHLDDTVKTELFRILQESLNNIIKHAQAQNIIIQFMEQEHYLEVFVEDDGIGFDMETIVSGQGLRSMETRAKIIKGFLTLYSEKEKGTSIAIQVPIKAKKKKRKNALLNFITRRP